MIAHFLSALSRYFDCCNESTTHLTIVIRSLESFDTILSSIIVIRLELKSLHFSGVKSFGMSKFGIQLTQISGMAYGTTTSLARKIKHRMPCKIWTMKKPKFAMLKRNLPIWDACVLQSRKHCEALRKRTRSFSLFCKNFFRSLKHCLKLAESVANEPILKQSLNSADELRLVLIFCWLKKSDASSRD